MTLLPAPPVLAPPSSAVTPLALPSMVGITGPMLSSLTAALGVERSILAADDQIDHAWTNLPRLLARIPPQQRTETLVRMCVAVATGLFDSAINYAWNAAIVELRAKVRQFGLTVIPQVTGRDFDEAALLDLKDVDLLNICLKLNMISEDGYFLLDQCRDIRNNFSAAHPSMGALDENEFLNFLNRIARHALANERNPRGVDIQLFIASIKAARFTDEQRQAWCTRLSETFDAQRELLFGTLHGIYCDPASGEEARVNALSICQFFAASMTPRARSGLVDRHQDYRAKGDEPRHRASQQFFERLGLIELLSSVEIHGIIVSAASNLLSVHNAFNNFYNEPPFAERLAGLTAGSRIPESAQYNFVEAVVTCATGNPYGVSTSAVPFYHSMVRSFSPGEIKTMLDIAQGRTIVGNRVRANIGCFTRFKELVSLLDVSSVPSLAKTQYESWMAAKI